MSRVLGIFAHPDDETLFAGGTFAMHAALGADVRLVSLTAGEALGPGQVTNYAHACRALGVAGWELAAPGRWRDRGGTDAPDSLAAAPLVDVVAVVREILERYPSDIVITADADGVTGNPDHVLVHDAVVAAGPEAEVWHACVRADAVRRATERLRTYAPDSQIGSGGIVGVPSDTELLEVELPLHARDSKVAAMDCYAPGLGSGPLSELVRAGAPVGDGVLLRAIVDVGADRELFRTVR